MIQNFKSFKNKKIIIFSDLSMLILKVGHKKIINYIIEIIEILIKNNNTIILPTYNFNFAKTKKTSSDNKFITTGYLNKYLLKQYEFLRTKKPIYNYAVLGPKKKEIVSLEQNTAFGKDSVIGSLSMHGAIALGIGVDPLNFNWVTIHVCEEISKVPYRFFKKFTGQNIDTKENVNEKIFVRKKKFKFIITGEKIYNILSNKKKIFSYKFKKLNITSVNLYNYYKAGTQLLKKNKYSLVK